MPKQRRVLASMMAAALAVVVLIAAGTLVCIPFTSLSAAELDASRSGYYSIDVWHIVKLGGDSLVPENGPLLPLPDPGQDRIDQVRTQRQLEAEHADHVNRFFQHVVNAKAAAARAVSTAKKAVVAVTRVASTPSVASGFWQRLGFCESGNTPTRNSGNSFYGEFQFTLSTWNSMKTGYARADLAPASVQLDAAQRLAARVNPFSQWPVCWPRALRG